jgi:Cutinase
VLTQASEREGLDRVGLRRGLLLLFTAVAAVCVAGSVLSPRASARGLTVTCPAVLVIDSRGSGEPVGKLSPPGAHLVTVLSGLVAPEKVRWIANAYPARGGFSILAGAKLHVPGAYFNSVKSGKTWLAAEIGKKRRDCPDTRLVLTGYSQGAQVTGDVLQHNGPFRNVVATVLFGDPYFNGRDPIDRGDPRFRTGVNGGLGERPRFAEPHVRSYCHSNDPVCQNTADPLAGFTWHDNYDKLGEPAEAAQTIANWLGVPVAGMNLTQVARGDFNSLRGKWTETAYALNRQFGAGIQWAYGSPSWLPKPSLAIYRRKLVFGPAPTTVVTHKRLTGPDDGGRFLPLSWTTGKNVLTASLVNQNVAVDYAVYFFRKGGASVTNVMHPNNEVRFGSSPTIVLWSSDNGYTQVFQR